VDVKELTRNSQLNVNNQTGNDISVDPEDAFK
jgi:hypothetical protein